MNTGAILVFGSINIDLVTEAPAIPRPGETVLGDTHRHWFGGKGANQAVAAARAGRGQVVMMAGAVGGDAFGRDAIANLVAAGVDVSAVAIVDGPTGCAFITVDPAGHNAITVASGANRAATADQVPDSLLAQAAILVLQMEVPLAESLALARRAHATGVPVLCNLAPPPAGPDAGLLRDLLALCNVLVVNEHEAMALARMLGTETATPEDAGRSASQQLGAMVVVTLGAQGAAAFPAGGIPIHVAAPSIQPVDTTGAGDTFAGILAAALACAMPLEPSLQRACRGAALTCLHAGAQPGMPHADQL